MTYKAATFLVALLLTVGVIILIFGFPGAAYTDPFPYGRLLPETGGKNHDSTLQRKAQSLPLVTTV